jgi:hypothetical protein
VYRVAPATALQVTTAVPEPVVPAVTDPPVGALRGAAPRTIGAATVIAIVAEAVWVPSVAVIVKLVVERVAFGVPVIRPVDVLKLNPPGRVPPEIEYATVEVKLLSANADVCVIATP